jgi:hypothetical protein
MEDGEYRRCSAPNCTSAAATNAHLCKRCQTRCDRGLLPNYKPFARGRPKKKISSLCPRRQKQVLKKLANDIISEVSERSLTPKHKEIITCLLGDAEVINTQPPTASPSAKMIENINSAFKSMDRSHLKTHLIQILSTGLSVAQTHSVLPTVSTRTIERAKHLWSYNEILNTRYPANTHRHRRGEEKELEFIRNLYYLWTDVVAPAQSGATLKRHRNDAEPVPKRLQRITDEEMYQIYVAEWTGAHMGEPRSKTYLVAHRYDGISALLNLIHAVDHLRFATAV